MLLPIRPRANRFSVPLPPFTVGVLPTLLMLLALRLRTGLATEKLLAMFMLAKLLDPAPVIPVPMVMLLGTLLLKAVISLLCNTSPPVVSRVPPRVMSRVAVAVCRVNAPVVVNALLPVLALITILSAVTVIAPLPLTMSILAFWV